MERLVVRRRLMVVNVTARAAAAGLLCVVVSACTGSTPTAGAPVHVVVPTRAPARAGGGGCSVGQGASDTSTAAHGLVDVDPSPTGVVVLWIPGANQRPCRAELTRGGPGVARALAAAVDTSPAIPSGPSACGADDSSGADLYFQYPDAPGELVSVGLTGCPEIDAPGRMGRQLSDEVAVALKPLAPSPWTGRLL